MPGKLQSSLPRFCFHVLCSIIGHYNMYAIFNYN